MSTEHGPHGGPRPFAPPAGPDPVAIGSLVASLVGLVTAGLGALVGIGLGIAALVRTSRSGRPGRGLAVAGIVVGAVVALGWLVAGIGLAALVVESVTTSVTQVTGDDLTDADGLTCDQVHDAEVATEPVGMPVPPALDAHARTTT